MSNGLEDLANHPTVIKVPTSCATVLGLGLEIFASKALDVIRMDLGRSWPEIEASDEPGWPTRRRR